ncbi:divergent polysaccharide deacetylase family protein [Sulfurimonas sp.]
MAKRKKNTSALSNALKYVVGFLLVIALVLGALFGGYHIGYEKAKDEITLEEKKKKEKRLSLLKKIEEKSKITKSSVNNRLKEVLREESKSKLVEDVKPISKVKITKKEKNEILKVRAYAGASHEYGDDTLTKPPSRVKRKVKQITPHKPRLAIIIDDVSVKSQVNAINSLGMPITMSFLPPSSARPNSAKLASKENFYMVHLPMEAQKYTGNEPKTLRVNDSQQVISARVEEIKKLFPKVKFINNHTGSKYTANEIAMNRLMFAFQENKINFIDSRTTSKTKAPKVMKNFGLKYIGRDVFLDHHTDKPYIKSQIKKAIKIAKNEGTAIAIGHPHANTILALHESKKFLKDVDVVLINRIY